MAVRVTPSQVAVMTTVVGWTAGAALVRPSATLDHVGVTAPLLTADARDLALLHRPRWQRRLLAWTLPAAVLGLIALHTVAAGPVVCTAQAPCQPDWLSSVSIGLLAAVAVAGFIFARLAVWYAGGFVVLLIGSERLLRPDVVSPIWLYLVDAGLVGLCVLLAGVSRDRRPTEQARRWLTGVRRHRPPPTDWYPRPGRYWRRSGWLLAMPAIACLGWGWYAQQQADTRERAAGRATGEVTAHVDAFTIAVRLSGETSPVSVFDVENYPVGQPIELFVDGAGLRQPVAEPYDATGWLALGVLLAGIAAAARARGLERDRGPRRFFAQEQPTTEVSVLPVLGGVAVYAGDARLGEPATMRIRCAVGELEPGPQPATLFGVPAPGHWCAVLVRGTLAVPARPVPAMTVLAAPPYGYVPLAPDDGSPAAPPPRRSDLPLRDSEIDALRPADRDAPLDQVRLHRRSPLAGYVNALALPLVGTGVARFLPELSYRTALLIVGTALALSCGLAWRLFLRARVAWNGWGVAVVGALGDQRASWRMVTGIDHDADSVTVHTGRNGLVVGAAPRVRILGRADRTAEELANALRHARDTATTRAGDRDRPSDSPDSLDGVPRLDPPRPPVGLCVLWLAGTPVLAGLLQLFAAL
jgi:hypothetical protein